MGRLAGFSYREVTRKLRKLGFEFYRTGKGDQTLNSRTLRDKTVAEVRCG